MKRVELKKYYSLKGHKAIEKIIKYLYKVGKKEDNFYIQAQGEEILIGNQYIALYLPIEDIGQDKICSQDLPLMKDYTLLIEDNRKGEIDFNEIMKNKEKEMEISNQVIYNLDSKDEKLSYIISFIFSLYGYVPSIERIQKVFLSLWEITGGKITLSIYPKEKSVVFIFDFQNNIKLLMTSYVTLSCFEDYQNC